MSRYTSSQSRRAHPLFRGWVLRLFGMLLQMAVAGIAILLFIQRHMPSHHPIRPGELMGGTALIILLWAGNILLIGGASLMRQIPRPPRPL